jgi:hypothetical protein
MAKPFSRHLFRDDGRELGNLADSPDQSMKGDGLLERPRE